MNRKTIQILLVLLALLSSFAFADGSVYNNYRYGYSFDYNGYLLDNTNETIKTNFYNNDTSIDIYYEKFDPDVSNSYSYVNYSNKDIANSVYVDLLYDINEDFCGHNTRVIAWYRKDLKHLEGSYNYYTSIDIIKNYTEVYTIYIKSKNVIDYKAVLFNFNLMATDDSAPLNYKQFRRTVNPSWSQETTEFYDNDFSKKDYVELGYFEPTSKESMYRMNLYEQEIAHKVRYMLEYYDMSVLVPDGHLEQMTKEDRIVEFTYQTSYFGNFDGDMLYRILDGKEDESIEKLAKALKSAGGPILFRLNNEMNGDWCSYNALHYQKDTEIFVKAWQYIHDKIIAEGCDNVIFVFNPNEASFPNFKWNHYTNYFPTSSYADVIGVTGYNTGDYYEGETWRSFAQIYNKIMDDYEDRFHNYDFYITEFGSSTYGGDREEWFDDMLAVINNYDFKLAIYWSGVDWADKDTPARIYRIDGFPTITAKIKDYYQKQGAKFALKQNVEKIELKE